jgi:alkylation response protein AidB-like acyl-CoA dehydrogenase
MRTSEQNDLAVMLSGWLADHTDLDDARGERVAPAPLAGVAALGLLDMLMPGEGGSMSDLVLVQQMFAAASASAPAAASALARGLLAEHGVDAPGTVLPVCPPAGVAPVTVVRTGSQWRATGRVDVVAWCEGPEGLVVPAVDVDGRTYLLEIDPEEVEVRPRKTLDLSRAFVLVAMQGARPRAVHESDRTADLDDAVTLLCIADALGGAGRALDLTLEHVRTRTQFGQVVGSFQAVKHHCASMRVDLASAAAALRAAVESWGTPGSARATASAAAHALPACSRVASLALQLHGGMGFTWEHDLHLHLRRVKTDELLAGSPRAHTDRLVSLL